MTANAGYHAYNTGDVLTAAQVQFNLQNQTVMYFATTVARDAALTGAILIEGLVSYVPSTKMMYYNGSAWVAVGAALPLTTTGDTLYSSPGATAVRLGIGSTGQVLTVAAGVPSWATAAAGPRVIQVINVAYSTNTASSTSTYIDTGLTATITPTSASNKILVIVSQAGVYNSGAATSVNLKLVRDATDRLVFATRGAYGWIGIVQPQRKMIVAAWIEFIES